MKSSYKNFKIVTLKPCGQWQGRAPALCLYDDSFKPDQWLLFLSSLSGAKTLFNKPERIIKAEGHNCVAVQNLKIGEEQFRVVFKRHCPAPGLRNFFRSFQTPKAFRNFTTSLKLFSLDIPVVPPLAALAQKRTFRTIESIYITPYFQNSPNLYGFASTQFPVLTACLKRSLCFQLAEIFASLHKNGMWHRDAKAGNFIVSRTDNDEYKILLVDMDGIKKYILPSGEKQFCALWRLAASLMHITAVSRTDYYRTFNAYCDLTNIPASARSAIYRKIAAAVRTKYLQNRKKLS